MPIDAPHRNTATTEITMASVIASRAWRRAILRAGGVFHLDQFL
jgi:hypothetical protein